jgi:hypothetical protein
MPRLDRDPGRARLGILSSRKLAQEHPFEFSPMQTNVLLTEQTLFRRKLHSSRLFFSHRERKQQLTNCYTLTRTSLRSPWRKRFCLDSAPECRSSRSSLHLRAACAGSIVGTRRNRARRIRPETRHRIANQCSSGLNNRCDHVAALLARSSFSNGRGELVRPGDRRIGSNRGCASCWSSPMSQR